jgi:hypothetical protein
MTSAVIWKMVVLSSIFNAEFFLMNVLKHFTHDLPKYFSGILVLGYNGFVSYTTPCGQ